MAELQYSLDEYRRLDAGQFDFTDLLGLHNIPRALIGARIALGLSQEQFARLLDWHGNVVQRYEATDYSSCSFERVLRAASVLMQYHNFQEELAVEIDRQLQEQPPLLDS